MAVHRELVSAGKFDEKFRRALLDYYGYGYKPLASYDNWRRLNGILADYLDWAEEPGRGAVCERGFGADGGKSFPPRLSLLQVQAGGLSGDVFAHAGAAQREIFSARAAAAVQEDEERQMHLEDVLAAGGPSKRRTCWR